MQDRREEEHLKNLKEREELHQQRRLEAEQKLKEELERQRKREEQLAQEKREQLEEEERLAREKAKEKVQEMLRSIQHAQALEESRKQTANRISHASFRLSAKTKPWSCKSNGDARRTSNLEKRPRTLKPIERRCWPQSRRSKKSADKPSSTGWRRRRSI
jgi:hypothetical protein